MSKPITQSQRTKIRQLVLAGARTTDVVTKMHLNRNTVMRWRKRLGLSSKPILPAGKVLALLRKGIAQKKIARTLGVSQCAVSRFARAAGFVRPPRPLSETQILALMADIFRRADFARALAQKHDVSYKLVLKLAHQLLACEKFLPGWRTPLSSYLPSASVPTMKSATVAPTVPTEVQLQTKFILVVEKVLAICRLSQVPSDRGAFAAAISNHVVPLDTPLIYKKDWEIRLRTAIDTIAALRPGSPN